MLDLLRKEAEALTRNVYVLSDIPNARGIIGYWGGERSDLPNNVSPRAIALKSRRHIFSFDSDLLIDVGASSRGPIALFEYQLANGQSQNRIEQQGVPHFKDTQCTGTPLYASLDRCPPPLDAICLFGSPEVERWLRGLGLARYEYWQLRSEEYALQYEEEFMKSHCLYWNRPEAYAVLHPWSIIWPDDDVYAIPPMDCLALTLRDAEPWYEIWYCAATLGYQVKERIT